MTASALEKREKMAKRTERFKKFTADEIQKRDYNLDIFWLKDESLEDAEDLPEPDELVSEAIIHLEAAVDGLQEAMLLLERDGKGSGGE